MDSLVYLYTDSSIVEILLAAGADVNAADRRIRTALSRACFKGLPKVVEALLTSEEVDLNIKDLDYETPLIFASMSGQAEIVELLLSQPRLVDVNARDRYGMTALMYACQRNHVQVLKHLLNTHVDIGMKNPRYNYTALSYAIDQGSDELVEVLLNQMDESHTHIINQCDTNGYTPLYHASVKNRVKVVEHLLRWRTSMMNLRFSMRGAVNGGCIAVVNLFCDKGIRLS